MCSEISNIENQILSTRIIPLIVSDNLDTSKTLCEITIESGCKIIEYGIRHENSIVNYEIIANHLKEKYSDFYLGVGSISDIENAKKIINIGVDFIVGPGLNYDIAKECKKNNTYYIPGCATITEIINAKEIGCELIKIFPINCLGGKKFLRTIMSPLPWLKAIPAGGVSSDPQNIKEWLLSGAKAVTLGSDLYKKNNDKYPVEEIKTKLNSIMKEI